MLDGNEYRRRLESVSDPLLRFMLAQLYEAMVEISRQHEQIAKSQLMLAKTMKDMSDFNGIIATDVKALGRLVSGNEMVKSVPITDE